MNHHDCFASYMGYWAILPEIAHTSHRRYLAGEVRMDAAPPANEPYSIHGGVAFLAVDGLMMKQRSKLGGTSTVHLRSEFRRAMADPQVGGMMVRFTTPGGHVDGTHEAFADMLALNAVKPVHAYAEDLMASAGAWLGAAARRVTANSNASIGSIGVMVSMMDTSKADEIAGVKMVTITSDGAAWKAVGDGPLTQEAIEYITGMVNAKADIMLGDIVAGPRGTLTRKDIKAMGGKVFHAAEAKSLGLIDKVETFEEAMTNIQAVVARSSTGRRLTNARIAAA